MTFFVFSVLPAPDSPLKTKERDSMDVRGQTEGVRSVSESRMSERKQTDIVFTLVSLPTNNYDTLCLQLRITGI